MDLMVERINKNLEAKQIPFASMTTRPNTSWSEPAPTAVTAHVPARALQEYIEDPLSEALIQGYCRDPASWIFTSAIWAFTTATSLPRPKPLP